jgi:hypothetical protein
MSLGAFPVLKRETEIEIADKILITFNRSVRHRPISVYDLVVVNGVTLILSRTGWAKVPEAALEIILSKINTNINE